MFQLPTHTLRYYESEGLLPPIERLPNGRRIYQESDVRRIRMILCMREPGMSVDSIKRFNELNDLGDEALLEKRQIILEQKTQIEGKIRELQYLLGLLNRKLNHYDEQLANMESASSREP